MSIGGQTIRLITTIAVAVLVLVMPIYVAEAEGEADNLLTATRRFKRIQHPPKGNINDFVQDEQGFIWIAGNEGLGRFDGYHFRHFLPDGKAGSLANDTVSSLQPDGKGSLWIGTAKGLERLDLRTLTFEQFRADPNVPDSLDGTVVTKLLRGKDGGIWIGTDTGLSLLDPVAKTFKNYAIGDAEQPKPVLSLLEDQAGTLWVGTVEGLTKFDAAAGRVVPVAVKLADEDEFELASVNALAQTSDGTLWVGTTDGLFVLDPATFALTRRWAQQLRIITALRAANDGVLIIGTREDGVFFSSSQTGSLVNHRANPNRDDTIQNPYVNSLYIDGGGVLWVGFYSGGVVKSDLANAGIQYFATKPGLAYYEEPSGIVWIGHEGSLEGSGLRRFDPKTGRSEMFLQEEREGTWITQIEPDDEGWLWLGTSELGLFRYNPTTRELRHFTSTAADKERVSADGVFPLAFDAKHRRMWIGTVGGGLDAYDLRGGSFKRYRADGTSDSLSSDYVFALHLDRKDPDILWIGTANGGLNRLQISTGTFTQYLPAKEGEDATNKLSHEYVTSIHESGDGTLWLGTYGGGLVRFDRPTNTFKTFGAAQGLPTNVIFGVMEDKTGALWMTSNSGLIKFQPDVGASFTFTEADGIGQEDFTQHAYYQGPSGLLYVGGNRGFNIIDPSKLEPSTYAGAVRLTGLRVFGKPRPIDETGMRFSYRDGVIRFDFASLSFADPERIRYRYRLQPLYDEWLEPTNPSVEFTNLNGGSYTLEIQATNHHGVTADKIFRMPFYVAPPPWRTWWAYGIYLALIGLIVFAVIRIQRRRILTLQRRNRLDAVERDLELTGAVQMGFLPDVNEVNTQNIELYGYYRPADACGGDWWWHEELVGGRHIIMVGDVTGHGPGPAMVTAAVATAFRVLVETGLDDTEQGLHHLNREVLRVGRGRYHMTMAAIELDETTGRFKFFSAGAPPMLSLNHLGKHRVHFCPGAPLGTAEGFEIGRVEGKLNPADRILVYTDGIPEIALANGAQLGMRRFAQLYERTRAQHVRDAAQTIVVHADQSRGDGPQLDDWTFTIVEWRGGMQARA
jgi:ligand-binding sensor domain-containing protein/serine phosphatase RsbU (regulator of sigma subunit)